MREVSSLSVLVPFNLTIRQRILNFVCAGQRMKMFLAKKKPNNQVNMNIQKQNIRAFSGLVFMRHEGPADEGFSAVQT